jgi:hypothetical protein
LWIISKSILRYLRRKLDWTVSTSGYDSNIKRNFRKIVNQNVKTFETWEGGSVRCTVAKLEESVVLFQE